MKKKMLNRKGDISARKVVFYAIFGFVAAISFLMITLLISNDRSGIAKMPEGLENFVIIRRISSSPECFPQASQAAAGAYPGIFSVEKLNQETLDNCLSSRNNKVNAYRLAFPSNPEIAPIQTKNWEGYTTSASEEHIIISSGSSMSKSKIRIEVQNARK